MDYRKIVTHAWVHDQAMKLEDEGAFCDAFGIRKDTWTSWKTGWVSPTTGKKKPISKIAAAALWYAVKLWHQRKQQAYKVVMPQEAKQHLINAISSKLVSDSEMSIDTGVDASSIRAWKAHNARPMSRYAQIVCYAYVELRKINGAFNAKPIETKEKEVKDEG